MAMVECKVAAVASQKALQQWHPSTYGMMNGLPYLGPPTRTGSVQPINYIGPEECRYSVQIRIYILTLS